jgi:hypothetical protein
VIVGPHHDGDVLDRDDEQQRMMINDKTPSTLSGAGLAPFAAAASLCLSMACSNATSNAVCSAMGIERARWITGDDATLTCILHDSVPIWSVVDKLLFGAGPQDSLRTVLMRLEGPFGTRLSDEVRWSVVLRPQARLEVACVPTRSDGEGGCVWQMEAYPVAGRNDNLVNGVLTEAVRQEADRLGPEASIVLTLESTRDPRSYFRARYKGSDLIALGWVDGSIPKDFTPGFVVPSPR